MLHIYRLFSSNYSAIFQYKQQQQQAIKIKSQTM